MDEVKALKEQVTADEKFIKETSASLATKKDQWKARQALRAGEVEAISKAIYILHNDDARDNFKKSFKSQGFVQFSKTGHMAVLQSANQAATELRKAAMATGNQDLLA